MYTQQTLAPTRADTNLNANTTPQTPEFDYTDNEAVSLWFTDTPGVIRYAHLIQNPVFDSVDGDRTDAMKDEIDGWIDDLKAATEDTIESEEFQQWLDLKAEFHSYSFRNTVLIKIQYPEATRVAGASTWNDLGRYPIKRSKSIRILCPLTTTGKKCPDCGCTGDYNPAVGEKRSDCSAAENHSECSFNTPPSEWTTGEIVYGYTDGWVFDVTQTDGEPLPDAPGHEAVGENGEEAYATLRGAAESLGITVEEGEVSGSRNGWSDTKGTVRIQERENKADQTRTLAHEIAHEELHDVDDVLDDREEAAQEVEAEAVGYIVSRYFGMEADDSGFYLGSWSEDSPEILEERLNRISRASKKILGAL